MLIYNFDKRINQLLIQPRGELDEQLVPQLKYCYGKHKQRLESVVFDCKAVSYIDSTVIPTIVEIHADASEHAFNIIFCNMNDSILQEFRLLNLHKLFQPVLDKENMVVTWQLRHVSVE